MENLFSYGTLQEKGVQLELFGRQVSGHFDRLRGYSRVAIRLGDSEFHSSSSEYWILRKGGPDEVIEGTVLELTLAEVVICDTYEPPEYARACVQLESGKQAWIYLAADEV